MSVLYIIIHITRTSLKPCKIAAAKTKVKTEFSCLYTLAIYSISVLTFCNSQYLVEKILILQIVDADTILV